MILSINSLSPFFSGISETLLSSASGEANLFLEAHLIQGRRVLPMTATLGYMAAAVLRQHPGFHLVAIQEAQLFSSLVDFSISKQRHAH